MNRILVTLALTSWLAAPALAADPLDPHCTDFMGMDADGRMQAMHEGAGDMMGGENGMMMEPGEMMERGGEACEAHPGGTVGEAMRMMDSR